MISFGRLANCNAHKKDSVLICDVLFFLAISVYMLSVRYKNIYSKRWKEIIGFIIFGFASVCFFLYISIWSFEMAFSPLENWVIEYIINKVTIPNFYGIICIFCHVWNKLLFKNSIDICLQFSINSIVVYLFSNAYLQCRHT